ncbi:MAG: DUF4262 domain-containing protein, partial [Actinobacteria bacterium]|nr:DUF4262 domain-containing protein [Actinomycetota bacterium]
HLRDASCVGGRWFLSNSSSLLRGLFSWTSAREVSPYRWFSVAMCIMCDGGATLDEARFNIHGIIDSFGWFIQYVEVAPVSRAWAYTVGLSAGFAHPELIITGVRAQTAARVLNQIGEMIRSGGAFTAGDCLTDAGGKHIHLSVVHPEHFDRGLFAVWSDYYDCLGPPYPEAVALEIVLPGRKPMLAARRSPIG